METKRIKLMMVISFVMLSGLFLNAQENNKISGFIGYGSEIKSIGFGVGAEFQIMENLTIAPNFTYFLPKDENSMVKITIFEVNANANYYFLNDSQFSFYGLAGLNYTNVKVKVDDFGFGIGGATSSEGKVGLNLGAGSNFNLDKSWTPFAEIKYVVGDFDQIVVLAGVKFNI